MSEDEKIKCLIVDDELPALNILKEYAGQIPFLEVVAVCENAFKALEILRSNSVDLVFLDIQMPGLTGLEMIKTVKNPPLVIFTTAYSQYAVEGYDLDVVDYLLKPVSFERFLKAVNKSSERMKLRKPQQTVLTDNQLKQGKERDFFFVKVNYKMIKVFFDDILFIEGLSEYVKIHTKEKNLVVLEALKNLETVLPGDRFVRIHKSYIVSIEKIDSVFGNTVEIGGEMLPIGKSYKESVMKKFF